MIVEDLGLMPYRDAWKRQEEVHAEVLAGGEERLLLVEHPPVITYGRRPDGAKNILASPERLAELGVEVVQSDRGGDVTFHGPGQLVAYPIIRLKEHGLSVGGYVKALQEAVIATLAEFGVEGKLDPTAVGVWVEEQGTLAKICALGVRIRRGTTMHGLALNISTDLRHYDLINPCGLHRPITSLTELRGNKLPSPVIIRSGLIQALCASLSA